MIYFHMDQQMFSFRCVNTAVGPYLKNKSLNKYYNAIIIYLLLTFTICCVILSRILKNKSPFYCTIVPMVKYRDIFRYVIRIHIKPVLSTYILCVCLIQVDVTRCRAALSPDMLATDLAYYLVRKKVNRETNTQTKEQPTNYFLELIADSKSPQ